MSEEERKSAKVTPLPNRAKSILKENVGIYNDQEKDRVNFRRSLTRLLPNQSIEPKMNAQSE